jgi:hypothetical protein
VFALMGDGLGSGVLSGSAPRTMAQLEANVADARTEVTEAEREVAAEQAELDRLLAAADEAAPGEIAGQRGSLAGANGALTGAKAKRDVAVNALQQRQDRLAELRKVLERLTINEAEAKAKSDADALSEIVTAREILNRELARPEGPSEGLDVTINPDGKVNVNLSLARQGGMQSIFEQIKEANQRGAVEVNTGNPAWDKKIRHKLENPELAWYKIQNTAYKFSFLLVPISLPFLWLLFFWKRGVTLYDHIVFSLYSLSFMSLLFVLFASAARVPGNMLDAVMGTLGTALVIVVPVHMFFHLKGTYGLGWFSAFWRMVVLTCLLLWVTSAMFVIAIFMLGLLG